jgi:hypothetical protein
MRKLLTIAGAVALAVAAIGINRIVVTDGHIEAAAPAFKSDYFPLER